MGKKDGIKRKRKLTEEAKTEEADENLPLPTTRMSDDVPRKKVSFRGGRLYPRG
jgi:hypothetical protein